MCLKNLGLFLNYSLTELDVARFDLLAPILLEYSLERFFEAGEGAKAV